MSLAKRNTSNVSAALDAYRASLAAGVNPSELPAVAANHGAEVCLVCDLSGSMTDEADDGERRIDHLRKAVREVLPHMPGARLIRFASSAFRAGCVTRFAKNAADLGEPAGGTPMADGLRLAATATPRRVIVISDGTPGDKPAALMEADALRRKGAVIDVVFVGDSSDTEAVAFMQQLAGCGAGQYLFRRLGAANVPQLGATIRGLLA